MSSGKIARSMLYTVEDRRRIVGLDSLRFVCALWVALHHGARPEISTWLGLSDVAIAWNAIAFDGVAAVIVFFVISGLCVHYPYAGSERCYLPTYFARRFIRIGIPLIAILAFMEFSRPIVGNDVASAPKFILWSLWCELIYYLIYPILLLCFKKIGMVKVILLSFIAAYAVIISHWELLVYWEYSWKLAWITALPAWLLGCAIAQILAAGSLPLLPGSIWWWRLAAVFLSIPPKALVYASISPILIGNPATLGAFSIFVFFWVMKEIDNFGRHPPRIFVEWCGSWSYSLYLTHIIVIYACNEAFVHLNHFERWPLRMIAILTASYAFYCIFERPARVIARFAALRLRQPELAERIKSSFLGSLVIRLNCTPF